jgi:hypothetical protein
MSRSFASSPHAQAVLDLYPRSERLQVVAALNEERLRRRSLRHLLPRLASRLGYRRSRIVTLACPPPSHMVCSP